MTAVFPYVSTAPGNHRRDPLSTACSESFFLRTTWRWDASRGRGSYLAALSASAEPQPASGAKRFYTAIDISALLSEKLSVLKGACFASPHVCHLTVNSPERRNIPPSLPLLGQHLQEVWAWDMDKPFVMSPVELMAEGLIWHSLLCWIFSRGDCKQKAI